MCQRCDERSDFSWLRSSVCGFDESGEFDSDNYRCESLAALRAVSVRNHAVSWVDNHYLSHLPVKELGGFLILTWESNHWNTRGVWYLSGNVMKIATIDIVERCLSQYE